MKVRKILLKEETEKILHTKSNGDKLVAAASGDGYTAFTRDDVHIGHISAETDAAAIAEFSKKEPKYEALNMSLEELQRTADRYLDVEIDELMRTILEKTSNMNREQLSKLVRWCRNFYAVLEEFASDNMTEGCDVCDFVMSQRTGDEYDDDFDDLSSFNDCSEIKKADALYGVEERAELVEAVYTDTKGIMGVAGETYTTAKLRKIWNDSHNDDPSMAQYNGDYDKWVSDTLAQMSRNDDVDESFDRTSSINLNSVSWKVASLLDVDALGEDNWIEFIIDDVRDYGNEKTVRFEAIGETDHKYGFIRTVGNKCDVKFRNGSEALCNNPEEIARFIAGEFGISL